MGKCGLVSSVVSFSLFTLSPLYFHLSPLSHTFLWTMTFESISKDIIEFQSHKIIFATCFFSHTYPFFIEELQSQDAIFSLKISIATHPTSDEIHSSRDSRPGLFVTFASTWLHSLVSMTGMSSFGSMAASVAFEMCIMQSAYIHI